MHTSIDIMATESVLKIKEKNKIESLSEMCDWTGIDFER